MDFVILQVLNGLSFSMLLFLVASGLSLIFGLMGLVNLAHGSFYLLAAYIALSVVNLTDNFLHGLLVGCIVVPAVGVVAQRFFLQRFARNELAQVLLTFGFIFIIGDACLWIWGGLPQSLPKPEFLSRSIFWGDIVFPSYRLFMIVVGCVVAMGLWIFLEKTKVGAMVRAGVDNPEMAQAIGVNVPLLFTAVFALGTMLASLAGVLGGPLVGVYPGADLDILLLALVIIIIGGEGSLKGAFVGSLLIGMLDNFGKSLFPELSLFMIFAPMAIILAVRPQGLFGKS
ncbi:branched-chain amino acid ABC transporter permease [Thermodesulfobacteriota bacterium]